MVTLFNWANGGYDHYYHYFVLRLPNIFSRLAQVVGGMECGEHQTYDGQSTGEWGLDWKLWR